MDDKIPDEVIEQIKSAVREAIHEERENDRLRQEIQAQWDLLNRECISRECIVEHLIAHGVTFREG